MRSEAISTVSSDFSHFEPRETIISRILSHLKIHQNCKGRRTGVDRNAMFCQSTVETQAQNAKHCELKCLDLREITSAASKPTKSALACRDRSGHCAEKDFASRPICIQRNGRRSLSLYIYICTQRAREMCVCVSTCVHVKAHAPPSHHRGWATSNPHPYRTPSDPVRASSSRPASVRGKPLLHKGPGNSLLLDQ